MAAEEYTATVDELIDGYRAMRAREIPGDRVLASIQAVMEAERGIAAVQAAARADMQREVQTAEAQTADLEFFVLSESAEGTIGAFQTADMAQVFADRLNSIIINDTFHVTPSTPNQQGAEQ